MCVIASIATIKSRRVRFAPLLPSSAFKQARQTSTIRPYLTSVLERSSEETSTRPQEQKKEKEAADDSGLMVGTLCSTSGNIYKSQVGLKFRLVRGYDRRLSARCATSDMRDLTSYVVVLFVAVAVIGTAMSKPLWSTLADDNYLYPNVEFNNALPQYLAAQQNAYSPYYIYNVHANVPSTGVLTSGRPQVSQIPAYSIYYGTPIYDLRIPLNPIYPVLTPAHPAFPPRPLLPPTFGEQPDDVDIDDGVEKLDSNAGTKRPAGGEQDDDSITVEAV